MKRTLCQALLSITLVAGLYFSYDYFFDSGKVFAVSVSSDGHYAVTTDLKNYAILWNLQSHSKKIVARNANLYSAYFIKNSHYFAWQNNDTNTVYIANIHGDIVKQLRLPFASYGQVITSDLKTYVASDIDWNIYEVKNFKQPKISLLRKDKAGFYSAGVLSSLTLLDNNVDLLTSGLGTHFDEDPLYIGPKQLERNYRNSYTSLVEGNVLWNLATEQPVRKFPGNRVKTYATLSPDGKYVVGGDENQRFYVWSVNAEKPLYRLDDIWFGADPPRGPDGTPIDPVLKCNPAIPPPNDFDAFNPTNVDGLLSVKFIDMDGHYFCFILYAPYAVLYKIGSPKPLKFLSLGHRPFPSIHEYSLNHSLDTSPSAHILVTGKAYSAGIMVYRFEEKFAATYQSLGWSIKIIIGEIE